MHRVVRFSSKAGITLFIIVRAASVEAEIRPFLGVAVGVSTLSADARTDINPSMLASSSYDPKNGLGIEVNVGVHFTDYLSAQLEYSWDRHDVELRAIRAMLSPGDPHGVVSFYEQPRSSSQHAFIANVLLYFRDRGSWARPYLSVGAGASGFSSMSQSAGPSSADAQTPPARLSSIGPALETAVGIDLRIRRHWGFRYRFAETIRNNPIDEQISPPGMRPLATFRNLFGFVKQF